MSFLRYANPRNMWLGNLAMGAARGAYNLYRSHAANRLYGGGMRAQSGTAQSISHKRQNRTGVSNKRLRQIIDQEINKEKVAKYIDSEINMSDVTSILSSNADMLALNLTRQGTGAFERIGNKIALDYLRLKLQLFFNMKMNTNAGEFYAQHRPCRVTLIWDKEGDGNVIPTWDFIFGTTDNEGINSTYFGASVRPEQITRFVVLKDEVFCPAPTIPAEGSTLTANNTITNVVFVDWFLDLKKKGLITHFNHSQETPSPTDITTGTLILAMRTSSQVDSGMVNASTVSTDVNGSIARLKFHDK